MDAEQDDIGRVRATRLSYSRPMLVLYGAVRELTQAGSNAAANESASDPCPQIDLTRNYNQNCMN
jgi:hypothetical protein